MRRADRLFEIIQVLRSAKAPVTAARLGEDLEVSTRTIYRDVAALQAVRVPIEGGTGIGYVMRKGYDLPPLMFSTEEIEAITVGLDLIHRIGDRGLEMAARRVSAKIATVLPEDGRRALERTVLYSSHWGIPYPPSIDLQAVRRAIRQEQKLRLSYRDRESMVSERKVRPLAVIYYVEVVVLAAWCELREAFRHFRVDRVIACTVLDESFSDNGPDLRAAWLAARNSSAPPERGAP